VASARRRIRLRVSNLVIHSPVKPLDVDLDAKGLLYVRVRSGRVHRTLAIHDLVNADYDREGSLLGFEVLDVLARALSAVVPGRIRASGRPFAAAPGSFELAAAS
jgi:uncharacterized protein YuzE